MLIVDVLLVLPIKAWVFVFRELWSLLVMMASSVPGYTMIQSPREVNVGDRVVWLHNGKEEHGEIGEMWDYSNFARIRVDKRRYIISNGDLAPLYELIKEERYENEKLVPKLRDITLEYAEPLKVDKVFQTGEKIRCESLVEVDGFGVGVVRWIGTIDKKDGTLIAGVALLEPNNAGTDGFFLGKRLFQCEPRTGLFIPLARCRLVPDMSVQPAAGVSSVLQLRKHEPLFGDGHMGNEAYKNQQKMMDDIERSRQSPTRPVTNTSAVGWHNGYASPSSGYPLQGDVSSHGPVTRSQSKAGGSGPPSIGRHPSPEPRPEAKSRFVGREKGICGTKNSSSIEVSLYSLLTFSQVLNKYIEEYSMNEDSSVREVRKLLREFQMNLRSGHLVARHHVEALMARLRVMDQPTDQHDRLLQMAAARGECDNIFVDSNGQESFLYQLLVAPSPSEDLPRLQDLITQSFREANIGLAKASPCFIVQIPRYEDVKPIEYIFPSFFLDLESVHAPETAVMSSSSGDSTECYCCGDEASHECLDCISNLDNFGDPIVARAFCEKCLRLSHNRMKRSDHNPRLIERMASSSPFPEQPVKGELKPLELFAVICLALYDSQYVAFVKRGKGAAPWYFYSRTLDQARGVYVPEVKDCTQEVNDWLMDCDQNSRLRRRVQRAKRYSANSEMLHEVWSDVPSLVRRFISDGYIYFYQQPVMGESFG